MRKTLDRKFWSLGTPLGSLGPLSQEAPILGFDQHQILVIWGPYDPPEVTPLQTQAKNPKTAGAWCGYGEDRMAEKGISLCTANF